MEKSTENNNNKNFLKKGLQGNIAKHHKEYLGTTVPEGYFVKSKLSILEKIKEEQKVVEAPKKQKVLWLQPKFRYIAAAVIFLLSLTVWLQNVNSGTEEQVNIELLSFNEDVLLNSLLIDDNQMNAYAEATLINEVVIKAELSEQKLDNLILDAMTSEDSLLDDYLGDELLENIIL